MVFSVGRQVNCSSLSLILRFKPLSYLAVTGSVPTAFPGPSLTSAAWDTV